MNTMQRQPRLRATKIEDFTAIAAIEQEAFAHPWPAEAFTDFLLPWAWTMLLDEEIIGYIFYHGGDDEMVIINVAVSPTHQGKGWGEYMLKNSLELMIEQGVRHFYLDVRVSNMPARNLYEKYGFSSLGYRRNYYSHPDEDALVMGKTIS